MLDHVKGHRLLELLHKMGDLRPGADQAHVPFQHVEELGQLVDAALADQAAEPGLAGVGVLGPAGVLAGVYPHAAELVHGEGLFVQAHPLLPEQDRPRAGKPHPDGRDQHDGAGEHDQNKAARHIHGPL